MKPTPEMIAAGLQASYTLRDSGDPKKGLKPISFTGNQRAHVEAIGEAMLADIPEHLHAQFPCPGCGHPIEVTAAGPQGVPPRTTRKRKP